MEAFTPLRALPSNVTNEVICVRVSRLWYHRGGVREGAIKEIHMVLLDSEGAALHAIVPHGFFQPFLDILHEISVYEISRFVLLKKKEFMRPVDAEFAIMFTYLTVVRRRDDLIDTLPEYYCSLTPFSSLPAPTADAGCLIDVVGTICGISDVKSFNIPRRHDALLTRHVYLRDLSGHVIKIVLWGTSALRFRGGTIRARWQTESAVAVFVGTTVQEYDGTRGLAGGDACSWYINADIPDINVVRASLLDAFQPMELAPLPHVVSLRAQAGHNWPKKKIAQLCAFNLFENEESTFRCVVKMSRFSTKQRWWSTICTRCSRASRPSNSRYGAAPTYTCTSRSCNSTTATIVYRISVIASDDTGEAVFNFFGNIANQLIGCPIRRVIRKNQPSEDAIFDYEIAASQVRFPPPQISKILSGRYRLVVSIGEGGFYGPNTSFMVQAIEAAFPAVRRLSSLDTVIPATNWQVVAPSPPIIPLAEGVAPASTDPSEEAGTSGSHA